MTSTVTVENLQVVLWRFKRRFGATETTFRADACVFSSNLRSRHVLVIVSIHTSINSYVNSYIYELIHLSHEIYEFIHLVWKKSHDKIRLGEFVKDGNFQKRKNVSTNKFEARVDNGYSVWSGY